MAKCQGAWLLQLFFSFSGRFLKQMKESNLPQATFLISLYFTQLGQFQMLSMYIMTDQIGYILYEHCFSPELISNPHLHTIFTIKSVSHTSGSEVAKRRLLCVSLEQLKYTLHTLLFLNNVKNSHNFCKQMHLICKQCRSHALPPPASKDSGGFPFACRK